MPVEQDKILIRKTARTPYTRERPGKVALRSLHWNKWTTLSKMEFQDTITPKYNTLAN